MKTLPTLAGVVVALACATTAEADPGTIGTVGMRWDGVEWGKVLAQVDGFARGNAESPLAPSRFETTTSSGEPYVQTAGSAWFGVAPHVSFVARDWGTAYRLAGDRLSLVDAMRLSSSTRMVMTRIRLGDRRIVPFTQLGVGQWRVDPALLPLTPRSTEIAGQLGAGLELNVAAWRLACEATTTAIVRDRRDVGDVPQTRMWSAMLASSVAF